MAFLHSARAGISPAVRRVGPPLLRLVAGVIVLAATALGTAISGKLNSIGTTITNA